MSSGEALTSAAVTGDSFTDFEARIQTIGRALFERSLSAVPNVLHPQWWQQRLLERAMRDDALRTQLFRFVDVLPALRSSGEVAAHWDDYVFRQWRSAPRDVRWLRSPHAPAARLAAIFARRNVRQLARRFIAGETLDEAITTIQRLRQHGMKFTLDLLGEAVTSDAQADAYAHRYLTVIDGLSDAVASWPPASQCGDDPDAPVPRVNVSLKLSTLHPHFDAIAAARVTQAVAARLRPILRRARERQAFVHIDMEQYAQKDLVLDVFKSVLFEDEFRGWSDVGVVLQAYLRETERDCVGLVDWVNRRGHRIVVRLVKGAYWDTEIAYAAQRNWPCPVFTHKWETDAAFERVTALLFEHHTLLRPAIASHNLRSLAHAIALAEHQGLSPRDFEIQMLFGLGDPLKVALVEQGLRLRIYTPYGPLIPGMGYLIRRLLENTSNDSFLRQSFAEHVPIQTLLLNPEPFPSRLPQRPAAGEERRIPRTRKPNPAAPAIDVVHRMDVEQGGSFTNEPPTDFRIESQRLAFASALSAVREHQCGDTYPLVIGGERVLGARHLDSIDPSHPACVVGRVACAGIDEAERAVAAARNAWPSWSGTASAQRAAIVRRLAQRLRERRFELAAWITIEAGKPWREADGDVAEAIDYCELYAIDADRLQSHPSQRHVPGEENVLFYAPRGVAAIIAPWNFPLAILTGMTTAALVTGNTVVIKPAEQSPVIAAKLMELLTEAGLPDGVANYLPGVGAEVGTHLVTHPDVDLIAFTGSRAVGLQIIAAAAETRQGQRMVKRVIAEMGGKNAIIVDADADLDEAVIGVSTSAFGYAGQKCSACSRVIVLDSVHDLFLSRLVETTRSLPVGPADDPATIVGPLIDADARDKVLRYIEIGKQEAELACEVHVSGDGYLVGPVIFDRVPPKAVIAQEEIFGPVLAVSSAATFADALALANDTDYGLTGGVYSRRPAHIERAKREFRVGNLYINRPITGALVHRQPFGGIKLSGVGSKAGGPDYLVQCCELRSISENTIRHGFTAPG